MAVGPGVTFGLLGVVAVGPGLTLGLLGVQLVSVGLGMAVGPRMTIGLAVPIHILNFLLSAKFIA